MSLLYLYNNFYGALSTSNCWKCAVTLQEKLSLAFQFCKTFANKNAFKKILFQTEGGHELFLYAFQKIVQNINGFILTPPNNKTLKQQQKAFTIHVQPLDL